MWRVTAMPLALLFSTCAFGSRQACAQHHPEHKVGHVARAVHQEHPKAHHEEHKHDGKKAEHEAAKKKHEEAERKKHAEAEHEKQRKERERLALKKREAQDKDRRLEHEKNANKKNHDSAHERQIVDGLRRIGEQLHRADHDYDNQRHEAVHHIASAVADMKQPRPDWNGKFGDMTQAKSDAILREQLGPLNAIRGQLAAKGAPAHHGAALRQVDEAITKIHSALRVR
jgi:Skp family chaperone for outer membrane proteins